MAAAPNGHGSRADGDAGVPEPAPPAIPTFVLLYGTLNMLTFALFAMPTPQYIYGFFTEKTPGKGRAFVTSCPVGLPAHYHTHFPSQTHSLPTYYHVTQPGVRVQTQDTDIPHTLHTHAPRPPPCYVGPSRLQAFRNTFLLPFTVTVLRAFNLLMVKVLVVCSGHRCCFVRCTHARASFTFAGVVAYSRLLPPFAPPRYAP